MQTNYNQHTRLALRLATAAAVALAAMLGGCGEKRAKGASQTAAKVNKEEITVHQINFLLQQQRNLRPENTEAASRQVLERLIDQELATQKASDLKLDRDPRVVQQMEAAKREIIARAYVDKIGEAAAKPTAEEIKKYYADKPALFSQRRIYNLQEIVIEAKPEQIEGLRAKPAIEQYLLNERRRQLIERDLKEMRSIARIEYVGKFAQPAASAPRADTAASEAPAATPAPASAVLDADAISKGLGGK